MLAGSQVYHEQKGSIMQPLNFLSHEQVSERLFIFTEGYSMVHRFTIGVVVGDEKILVIDAGLGATGDLRKAIESVIGTAKPVICACTHCHPDHVGSAKLFDEAYCSHLDWPSRADFALNMQQRLTDLNAFALNSPEVMEYCQEHILENSDATFKDIQDGDVFDLGGVKIEAIAIPGHSAGSMAFYNAAEKYVFTGDAINTDVHLKKLDRAGFEGYIASLESFIARVAPDVTLYPAHLPLAMDLQIARNLIVVCEDLLAGRTAGDPPGETIFAERNNNPEHRMHYYNNTCVVYNERLLYGGEARPENARGPLNFYSHEHVAERVYVVTEGYSMVHRFTIGVVIGDEKILVIDSGLGMDADLRAYIESFAGASKPMICVCTHGAIDHAGAACLFDEAYFNERDIPMLAGAFDQGRRMRDLAAFSLFNEEVIEYGRAHKLDNTKTVLKNIDEGDVIDLGGICVEPISTPGHSKGHLSYYIPQEKIVFGGDGINIDTHIKSLDRAGLLAYRDMLYRFLFFTGEDVRIYAGHLNRPHKSNVPRNLALACEEVANGMTAGDPPGETIFLEKAGNPAMRMHYHGNSCIIYNADLLK